MKKVTYISLLLAFFFSFTGCITKGQIEGDNYLSNVFSKNNTQRNIILFFPDTDSRFLIPEERLIKLKGSIEKAIVEEILKGPLTAGKRETSLTKGDIASVKKNEDTVTVSLSGRYLKNGKLSMNDEISLYSIVNSLTELPGIKRVVFKTKNKALVLLEKGKLFNDPISRVRSVLNRSKSLNPKEVLNLQMIYEQQRKWLEAYILMSDDVNNIYRKSYDDYISEMREVSETGFTDQKYRVQDYKIVEKDSTARVRVSFYIKDASEMEKVEDFYFNCVKIDNIWMVDWLTYQ
jgi:hypothetical protein